MSWTPPNRVPDRVSEPLLGPARPRTGSGAPPQRGIPEPAVGVPGDRAGEPPRRDPRVVLLLELSGTHPVPPDRRPRPGGRRAEHDGELAGAERPVLPARDVGPVPAELAGLLVPQLLVGRRRQGGP